MPDRTITSRENPRVKAAARLRTARERKREGRFIIDGAREISHAIRGGVRLEEVFVCRELCRGDESREAIKLLPTARATVYDVTAGVFEKLAYGDRAEGISAVAAAPQRTLADLALGDLVPGGRPLVAVLEGVEKPGNVGAVLRSADGAGVSALVVADGRTDLYNPNCIRASLGAVFTLAVREASAAETIAWLRQHNLRVYVARVDATTPYTRADFTVPSAIVLGSEAAGVSAHWRAADFFAISLPQLGATDSLNLSAAAAVLFYEALRQRTV